jgi:hypothetical protein
MIDIAYHSANLVLQVERVKPTGISFLDMRIRSHRKRPKKQLTGPGIYMLFYEGQLIYIGKYRGRAGDPFSGDIAHQRWWAHIGELSRCEDMAFQFEKPLPARSPQ